MTQVNNPLHGVKLENLLNDLVDHYGWEELGRRIDIRCFNHDPSIKSSLKFLRKTPWAREKVEYLYLKMNKLPLPKPKQTQARQPQAAPKQTSENKSAAKPQVNSHIWGDKS
ncbi:VF530 family DNA-binding protein [Shewanella waksmanii]|uniref:VF530 family protein n=1 Tax=Shewanella waksmanii TaxID=213783 RepID=UPI003734CE1D